MPGINTGEDKLGDTQRWLLGAIMQGPADPASVAAELLPGGQLDAAGCLAIYQRSYRLRLRHCLSEQFPATRHALGEQLFDDFADAYLHDHPSTSYTLYELGNQFYSWMEATRPDRELPAEEREGWIDFMIDLAHYEGTLFYLYDAPGHEGQPWPTPESADNSLTLQPCLALARYRYPVAAYYHAVRDGKAGDFPAPTPSPLVILRRDYQTATYPVSDFHYRFLQAVSTEGNVARALEQMARHENRSIDLVAASWQREVKQAWIDAGFFVSSNEP